ncbi:hypothetical protein PIB30_090160, partial [Stylosanthes scabra]|nr:hypothetical protein [Stylosanthes scabra]
MIECHVLIFQQEEYFQNSSFKRMNMFSTPSDFKSIKESGRSSPSPFKWLATSWSKRSMLMLGNWTKQEENNAPTPQ